MLAALWAVLGQRRKAAWIVPQRSLTTELVRSLTKWKSLGLRIEVLSGEPAVDENKARLADVWVATTEKFEAISCATSLRSALDRVGVLVVDEIHLLGDTNRGATLEALLTRVRGPESPVRVVGLSATAANADEVAHWLGAKHVRTVWRPTRLTWQLPAVVASGNDWRTKETVRSRLAARITKTVVDDGGAVLVFCGSKRWADRVNGHWFRRQGMKAAEDCSAAWDSGCPVSERVSLWMVVGGGSRRPTRPMSRILRERRRSPWKTLRRSRVVIPKSA
ncbi:DEAD/DEAH box helicase [Actinokineospora iranica]|uniref:Helicase n=1 Tax=Actinokineospora iranica TaxID=1271860 RepID=A0A1G6K9B2_9PSEU|nr:DEAD/DEAH box helicase [Actinokineospora iranica]SDC27421.1 helicase [Actinokineospora iranica]